MLERCSVETKLHIYMIAVYDSDGKIQGKYQIKHDGKNRANVSSVRIYIWLFRDYLCEYNSTWGTCWVAGVVQRVPLSNPCPDKGGELHDNTSEGKRYTKIGTLNVLS